MIVTPLEMLVESVAALVAETASLSARVRLLQETLESEVGSRATLELEMFRRKRTADNQTDGYGED